MFSRRQVLSTGLGLGGATLLSACTTTRPRATTPITAPPTPSLGTPAVQATLRVGVEAAVGFGWGDILGDDGVFVGMPGFGASGPAGVLYRHFGITAGAIVAAVKARL